VIGFPFCDDFFLPPARRQDSPVRVCLEKMGKKLPAHKCWTPNWASKGNSEETVK